MRLSHVQPEHPIDDIKDDVLDRENFVINLSSTLINPLTKKSTGVVVGLTGEWGSGKTSVLNLLEKEIKGSFQTSVVVRFNPWLISEEHDLITQFFAELIASFNENRQVKKELLHYDLIDSLVDYGEILAPVIDQIAPGIRDVFSKGIRKILSRKDSLHLLRHKISKELLYINFPIVVLIDELDRVEDREVKKVAQLIKAVADFPNISYLVAYDNERVIEALGAESHLDQKERRLRGQRYLEKIIQYQISLPVLFSNELETIMLDGLKKLPYAVSLTDNPERKERFNKLQSILISSFVSTPRDVKRLLATYSVLLGMVHDEVNSADLLAYSAILVKAPLTAAMIKSEPDLYVANSISYDFYLKKNKIKENQNKDQLFGIAHEDEKDTKGLVELLRFMFPEILNERRDELIEDGINKRRALISVLKLGLPQGQVSREEVNKFFQATDIQKNLTFKELIENDRINIFLDRLEDMYTSRSQFPISSFWLFVSNFLAQEHPVAFDFNIKFELATYFEELLIRKTKLTSSENKVYIKLITELVNKKDMNLAPSVIRRHFSKFGLYNWKLSQNSPEILSKKLTEELAIKLSKIAVKQHISRKLFQTIWVPDVLFLAVETNLWGKKCHDLMTNLIKESDILIAFVTLLFRKGYRVDIEMVEKIVSVEELVNEIQINKNKKYSEFIQDAFSNALQNLLPQQ